MYQHVKSNFFLPFDPFVDGFSKEGIVFFLRQFTLTEGQTFSTNFLGLREWTDSCCWKSWKFKGFFLDSFTFSKGWQTSVVCVCQSSYTRTKFRICSDTFCCKEFFVSCKSLFTLTVADSIQVTEFFQFFNCKSKMIQDSWFKVFVGSRKWYMKQRARSCQDNIFSWNLFQNFQACFVVITPDVLTIDNTCIKSLISWETTFHKFKSFLPFNKVKTDSIYWQVHKVSVDVTHVTKVSLDQDLKTFFVSQEFIVEV